MCVDVFSYCTNIYVEHAVAQEMSKEKKLILLAGIPLFSVCLLLSVTIYVTYDAISVITKGDDDDSVNIYIMYGFACGNLVIDLISCWMFYINKDEALFSDVTNTASNSISATPAPGNEIEDAVTVVNPLANRPVDEETDVNPLRSRSVDEATVVDRWDSIDSGRMTRLSLMYEPVNNVNMMSALSHVSADTMRTLAVFTSAAVVSIFGVNSALSDAYASLFCNLTIVMTMLPLLGEIRKVFREYQVATKIAAEKAAAVSKPVAAPVRNSGNSIL